MRKITMICVALGLFVGACGDDDNSTTVETQAVELNFTGLVDGEAFSCSSAYELGTANTPSVFSEFKLYISSVELIKADGTAQALTFDHDGKWQYGDVALLDFEDATGSCLNGNADVNTVVKGTVPDADYTGLRFVLGVPFQSNHADAATAPAPLNLTSMFWSWQSGYKFLRVDGKAADAGFRVHLGSTGCAMGDGDTVETCTHPNRPTITFSDFDVSSDTVNVDIGKLFADLDMTPDANMNSRICMSGPNDEPCNQVFPLLGLDFGTTPATDQVLFSKN